MLGPRFVIATTGAAVREAVSVAHAVVAAGVIGVYGVATLPNHRRQGYGEALSWAATLTAPQPPRRIGAQQDG